ncbi:hypothetical protein ACVMDN_006754 [Bradyrhizobium sp. USDA 4510]
MSTWPATARCAKVCTGTSARRWSIPAGSGSRIARASRREPTLPGANPVWFFAPDQIRKRAKEWGPGGIDQRFGVAWAELVPHLPIWLDVVERRGPAAVREAYLDTLQGRVPPDQGLILSLAE